MWQEDLLPKLSSAKVAGRMCRWIKSFLCHRTARVKLENSLSHTIKVREGVPQGREISPTLFVVFINDITTSFSRHISRALDADDFPVWNAPESTATTTVKMQEAINNTSKWASDWCVTINCQKTVATCFSLSNFKEKLHLNVNNQPIPQVETPTYLGFKLREKKNNLTWNPHIKEMEKMATKRHSLMETIGAACTNWGATSSILRQVYIGNVRPVMGYGAATWATAAKSNTSRLAKRQCKSIRIITGGLKTTPTFATETASKLPSLDLGREEKVLIHSEKVKRLSAHPVSQHFQEPTKRKESQVEENQLQPSCQTSCNIPC